MARHWIPIYGLYFMWRRRDKHPLGSAIAAVVWSVIVLIVLIGAIFTFCSGGIK